MERCPVCQEEGRLFGSVDANVSCEDRRARVFAPAGVLVDYWRCERCRHIWCPERCRWTSEQFAEHIYNDEYVKVDPDYVEIRPAGNADVLDLMYGPYKAQFRHLDYGGGNGRMCELLRARGWDSRSWDPYVNDEPLEGVYEFITCFEVFEHHPQPRELAKALVERLTHTGVIFFSTALTDPAIRHTLDWWYVAPRNGHISLYSEASLGRLFAYHGYRVASLSSSFHLAVRSAPQWLFDALEKRA